MTKDCWTASSTSEPICSGKVGSCDTLWCYILIWRHKASPLSKKRHVQFLKDISSCFRCCKLDLFTADAAAWEEIETKIVECIRNTLDTRAQYYEEEVKKLSENRFLPGWNFVGFHMVKVSKSRHVDFNMLLHVE